MTASMTKTARAAAALVITSSFVVSSPAAPAPAPEPSATFVVANDGYLIVTNFGGEQALPPRLCPPGAGTLQGKCVVTENDLFKTDREVKPVTAQGALDMAYGVGKTKLVGLAPQGWGSTVIYYRVVPAAAR
jgi:hypothetical protein